MNTEAADERPAYGGVFEDEILVTLLTGYLGSGKSTLVNRLISAGWLRDAAFVVNEFGEIPIDHMLVDVPGERIALIEGGCVCCAVGSDLEQSLQNLFLRRARGLLPPFTSVIVETTGIASPGPILRDLAAPRLLAKNFRLAGVVALVDPFHAELTLATEAEAAEQVAAADAIVVTKIDLPDAPPMASVEKAVRALNPQVPIETAEDLVADPRWLGRDAIMRIAGVTPEADRAAVRRSGLSRLAATGPVHASPVSDLAYRVPEPVEWPAFERALGNAVKACGEGLLRMKGVVGVVGLDGHFVLQGVRGRIEPPEQAVLRDPPETGAVVFIGRNIEAARVDSALADFAERSRKAAPGNHSHGAAS